LLASKISIYLIFFVLGLDFLFSLYESRIDGGKSYVLGIPVWDYALFISLCYFVYVSMRRNSPFNVKIIILLFVGILYFIYGLVQNFSDLNWIFNDIRIFLWLFGGIGLGYLFNEVEDKLTFCTNILIFLSVVIILSSLLSLNSGLIMGLDRISHPNIFLSSCVYSYFFVFYSYLRDKSISTILASFIFIFIYFFFVVFLSATRSVFIIFLFFIFVFIHSQFYMKGKNSFISFALILFVPLILIILVPFFVDLDSFSSFNRVLDGITVQKSKDDIRLNEVFDFFQQMSLYDFLFGKGMGGKIYSSIYKGDPTTTLHVGIFNIWLKYGIFFFIIVFYYIYKVVLKVIFLSTKHTNFYRTSDIVYFSLIPWVLVFFLTGGYGELDFMLLGFSYYLVRM
jgi:hypothetical protein